MELTRTKLIVLLAIIMHVGVYICFWWQVGTREPAAMASYTIGLVSIPSRVYQEQAATAFIQSVKNDARSAGWWKFTIKEFSVAGSGDSVLLNAVCESAIQAGVDVIVTTGWMCSQAAVQACKRRHSSIPIVFLGVIDPVELEIVDSLKKPGGNATGVSPSGGVRTDPTLLLTAAKPDWKRALLPYGVVADGNEKYAESIRKRCALTGQEVTLLPIDNVSDTLLKIESLLSGHDVLMYLEGDLLVSYGAAFGKIASKYGVTMLAGSLDGLDESALTFADNPTPVAAEAFEMVKRILIRGESPATMSIECLPNVYGFTINRALCAEQDLADIDISRVVSAVRSDPSLESVHDHIIIK